MTEVENRYVNKVRCAKEFGPGQTVAGLASTNRKSACAKKAVENCNIKSSWEEQI
jgi:hypothetical protein